MLAHLLSDFVKRVRAVISLRGRERDQLEGGENRSEHEFGETTRHFFNFKKPGEYEE